MNWNDPITPGTDWTHIDFLTTFANAYNERWWAAHQWDFGSYWYPISFPTVHEPASGFVECVQGAPAIGIANIIRSFIIDACGTFVDPSLDLEAVGQDNWGFTVSTLCTAAGLSANGFRRRKPRELSSLASGTDKDGNAVADGQKAYYQGAVYLRAAGQWAVTQGAPDILDSELAAPNHVPHQNESTWFTYGFGGFGGSTRSALGDYIGDWWWNETRAALNVMLWTRSQYMWRSSATPTPLQQNFWGEARYRSGDETRSTWPPAKAAAEAEYSSAGITSFSSGAPRLYTRKTLSSGNHNYQVQGASAWLAHSARSWALLTLPMARRIRFYTAPAAVPFAGTFSAHGYPVAPDRYLLFETSAVTGDEVVTTSQPVVDLTVTPTDAPADPAAGGTTSLGFEYPGPPAADNFKALRCVIEWNVDGGFQYLPPAP